jgi:hypothetical protein
VATIGWIKVGTAVDTGGLSKGFQRAGSIVSDFGKGLIAAAAAYATFESLKGIGEFVKGTVDAIGATKVLAERVGFSVTAFEKLAYAARLAHVGQDELGVSLGQMNRKLAEAAVDGGGVSDVLRRFGLSARQLTSLGPEKAFSVLLDVMGKLENPMERSAFAVELFGRAGQGVINMVAQGHGAIDGFGNDALRVGSALDEIDNEKIVMAESAMMRLGMQIQGTANLLVAALSPYLTAAIESLLSWGASGTTAGQLIKQGMDWAATAIGIVVDAVHVLEAGFYTIKAVAGIIAQAIVFDFKFILEGVNSVISAGAKLASYFNSDLANALTSVEAAIDKFADGVGEYQKEIAENTKKDWAAAADAIGKVGKGRETVKGVMDAIESSATDRAKKAAEKANQFVEPGALVMKHQEVKFSAASDINDKSTYSAVLAAKGLQSSAEQQLLSVNKQTADATTASLGVLQAISTTLKAAGAGSGALKLGPDKF